MRVWSLFRKPVDRPKVSTALLLVAIALLAAGLKASADPGDREEYRTYTLDLSNVTYMQGPREVRGLLGMGFAQVVAFPLHLDSPRRKVARLGPDTIVKTQTKSLCMGDLRTWLTRHDGVVFNIEGVGSIRPRDTAVIKSVTVEMLHRNPSASGPIICPGFLTKRYGWIWIFSPIESARDDDRQLAIGRVEIDAYVDGLGILFHTGATVRAISFEARRPK